MNPSTPYTSDFFAAQESGSLRSARVVVPLVLSLGAVGSVVDFGCGNGTWLKAFHENGVNDLLGLDGSYVDRSQLLIPAHQFRQVDLAASIPVLGRVFDLAVSLEVAEHLPKDKAIELVERLTAAAPRVLFSAAVPYQDGTHHINPQWPQYWRSLFADHNYRRLDPIRPKVWQHAEVEWWYKQNTYFFCHERLIAEDTILRREAEVAERCPFELVFHEVFDPLTERVGVFRRLGRIVRKALLSMGRSSPTRRQDTHIPPTHV